MFKNSWMMAWVVSIAFHAVLLGCLASTHGDSSAVDKALALGSRINAVENQPVGEQAKPAEPSVETKPVEPKQPETKPAEPKPVLPVETKTASYTVKSGDNFTVIAKRYGLTNAELAALNGKPLRSFNVLRLGQVLKVPAAKGE